MHAESRQGGQVLVILLGALFLGAGVAAGSLATGMSLKDLDKGIKALDLGDTREDQARDVISRWEDLARPALKQRKRNVDAIVDLLGEQYAPEEKLRAAFDALQADADATVSGVLALRDELRAALGEGDWERLFADR